MAESTWACTVHVSANAFISNIRFFNAYQYHSGGFILSEPALYSPVALHQLLIHAGYKLGISLGGAEALGEAGAISQHTYGQPLGYEMHTVMGKVGREGNTIAEAKHVESQ